MVPVRKNGRHGKILDLVARRPVSSQLELAALLRAQGVEVTQSTLSRDIHTLGLVKVRGLYRSAPSAAASAAAAPPDAMRRNLRQLVVRSGVSGNIVMVKTAPGNAHALGGVLDTVFLCTPNEGSYELVPKLLDYGMGVIDLSGSFRLRDIASYSPWYGFHYVDAKVLGLAVYGLSEGNGARLGAARLVANPGC